MRELQSQVCKCVNITEESNGCMYATVYRRLIDLCKQLFAFLTEPYTPRNWGHSHLRTNRTQKYAWLLVEAPHIIVQRDSDMPCHYDQSKL